MILQDFTRKMDGNVSDIEVNLIFTGFTIGSIFKINSRADISANLGKWVEFELLFSVQFDLDFYTTLEETY